MTARPTDPVEPCEYRDDSFAAYCYGFADGYRKAMTVLDDAASVLAQLRPSRLLTERRGVYARPARSAAEIRRDAYASWGLPDPLAPP
jgi:hypothetical protein